MKLDFHKNEISCIKEILSQCKEQEVTQEYRLPDGMPDIGRVVGAWGQVLIRGKEWRSDHVGYSGGVQLWVIYTGEDEADPRVIETWLPFNAKWNIQEADRDGSIIAFAHLSFADARSVSARKLILRAGLCVDVRAYVRTEACIYEPENLPVDIQIKKSKYYVRLPSETGERTFTIEEQVPLTYNDLQLEQIVRYSLNPVLLECKVLGGRLVFRGNAILHLVYWDEEGVLAGFDVELPFSQFAQLEKDYEEGSEATVSIVVTNLELEMDDNRQICLKAGLSGQFIVQDRLMIEIADDAYSTKNQIYSVFEPVQIPNILDCRTDMISVQRSVSLDADRIVDSDFLPQLTQIQIRSGNAELLVGGRFQILYYDHSGSLQCASANWDKECLLKQEESLIIRPELRLSGKVMVTNSSEMELNAELQLNTTFCAEKELESIAALDIDENEACNSQCAGVIIRRMQGDSLWSVAKQTGSTVQAILEANGLTDEPQESTMLIIPIL